VNASIRCLHSYGGLTRVFYRDRSLLLYRCPLPCSKWENNAWVARTDFVANKLLEFRSIWSPAVLLLAKQLRSTRQCIISPLTIEVQPVHRVAGVVRLKCPAVGIVAVRIGAQYGIPQLPAVSMVNNKSGGKIEMRYRMVMIPRRGSYSLASAPSLRSFVGLLTPR
jgi:hypothetical protein